jgi:prophage regulatory protein
MTETRLIRRPEVERLTGLKRSAIYANMKSGSFPAAVRIGPRAVAWPLSSILNWIESRPEIEIEHQAETGEAA